MPAITSSAPGKTILTGEHAVVYGYPAIAVPLPDVQARVHILANPKGKSGEVLIDAPAIQLKSMLDDLDSLHPFRILLGNISHEFDLEKMPACNIKITSSIPLASGLGSGAAVSIALIRGVSSFLGHPLPDEKVNRMAYEIEKIYHGMPSGIDNTVITYNRPVYFKKGDLIEFLDLKMPLILVMANTGIPAETKKIVGEIHSAMELESDKYHALFRLISRITDESRIYLEEGELAKLGRALTENHHLLQEVGVSCTELDHLVEVALQEGALGAKLSGAGRGGNMIALVTEDLQDKILRSLQENGAVNAFSSVVSAARN